MKCTLPQKFKASHARDLREKVFLNEIFEKVGLAREKIKIKRTRGKYRCYYGTILNFYAMFKKCLQIM